MFYIIGDGRFIRDVLKIVRVIKSNQVFSAFVIKLPFMLAVLIA